MRRALFALLLPVYAVGVLDLHEWVHVPQSIVHWLEHHSDLGHKDAPGTDHEHAPGDHDPFACDQHGPCTTISALSIAMEPGVISLHVPVMARPLAAAVDEGAPAAFHGAKWNPPKA